MGLVVARGSEQYQLDSRYSDLMGSSTPDLIDFITEHFHEPLKKDMRLLEQNIRQFGIENGDVSLPSSLRQMLNEFISVQDMHLFKEESFLFPMMASMGSANDLKIKSLASRGIQALKGEHVDDLGRIQSILSSLKTLADSDIRICRLFEQVSEIYDKLGDHTYVEERILFARFS